MRWLVCFLLLLPAFACGGAETRDDDIAVQVLYVAVDPRSHSPVVILEELKGTRVLPIWIGFAEARSIAAQLGEVKPPRPGTHDLAKRLIDVLEGELDRVVVSDLADGIYYARLFVRSGAGVVEIDARPSDAIAIALRTRSPLFVREGVLAEAGELADLGLEEGQGI